MNQEQTIDLKDLTFHILLKWRFIISVICIFAILGGAFGAANAYRGVKLAEEKIKQKKADTDYSEYEESLSNTELLQTKDAAEDYRAYESAYRQLKKYYNVSMKMQMDASAVTEKELIYRISDTKNADEILELLKINLLDDKVCQDIIEANQWKIENMEYVKELISINDQSLDNMMEMEFNYSISEKTELSDVGLLHDGNSELLFVKVIAETEKECQNMANILQDTLTEAVAKLQKTYEQFSVQKLNETSSTGMDKELLQSQQEVLEEMNAMNSLMEAVDDSLSDSQKQYFLELINETVLEEKLDNAQTDEEVLKELPSAQYMNIKSIILGGVVGLLLSCFYLACRYMMNGRLNSAEYLLEEGNILLGTIYKNRYKKKFGNNVDCLIIRLFKGRDITFTKENRMQMVQANVLAAVRKNTVHNLYISSSVQEEDVKEIMIEMEEQMKAKEVLVEKGPTVLHSPESLEKLTMSQGVVFVEKSGVSYIQDIHDEVQICKKNDIPVIGFIIVDTLG